MRRLIFFLVFGFVCLFSHPLKATAQGTCSCLVDASRNCDLISTNCAVGYSPICVANIMQCNSLITSCTCTAIDPLADTSCGEVSQTCCGGDPFDHRNGICDRTELTCYSVQRAGYLCLTQEQINALPGGTSPPILAEIYCDASGNPSSIPAGRINTALGCIPYYAIPLIEAFLPWGLGIAGGVSLIVFAYASFLILTSTGNFKRVQAGRELFFASFVAICFIALSVVILNFLGLQILNLGSLGFSV